MPNSETTAEHPAPPRATSVQNARRVDGFPRRMLMGESYRAARRSVPGDPPRGPVRRREPCQRGQHAVSVRLRRRAVKSHGAPRDPRPRSSPGCPFGRRDPGGRVLGSGVSAPRCGLRSFAAQDHLGEVVSWSVRAPHIPRVEALVRIPDSHPVEVQVSDLARFTDGPPVRPVKALRREPMSGRREAFDLSSTRREARFPSSADLGGPR